MDSEKKPKQAFVTDKTSACLEKRKKQSLSCNLNIFPLGELDFIYFICEHNHLCPFWLELYFSSAWLYCHSDLQQEQQKE